MGAYEFSYRADSDFCRGPRRKSVDAGRYCRKRQGFERVAERKFQRGPISGGEEIPLPGLSSPPDRPDGVNDVTRRKPVAERDPRLAGRAAADLSAFRQKLRPRGAMDRSIDPAASEQAFIGGIDDGVERKRRNVSDDDANQSMMVAQRAASAT